MLPEPKLVHAGGIKEVQDLYDEAMDAIFNQKVDCHMFTQKSMSLKTPNQQRFSLFEMWPMPVRSWGPP